MLLTGYDKLKEFFKPFSPTMELCNDYSIEVTPRGYFKIRDVHSYLPKYTKVYITLVPGTNYTEIVKTAEQLKKDEFIPVPHIPARSIKDEDELYDYFGKLKYYADIDRCLIIGGGLSKPVGKFHESMQIINSGILEEYNLKKVGVAGHPEGNLDIPKNELMTSLQRKQNYDVNSDIEFYIVTQFSFSPYSIKKWEKRLKEYNIKMPVHIGIPGPASFTTLINYAKICGINKSLNFLIKNPKNMVKVGSKTSPEFLIRKVITNIYNEEDSLVKKLHVYPFGGVKTSAKLLNELKKGNKNIKV